MELTPDAIFETLDVTWPAARIEARDGWHFRAGLGGGKRVSAATATPARTS